MADSPTHYQVLGLAPTADRDEIHRAYLRKAREQHPDRLGELHDDARRQAEADMAGLNEAWRVLGHPGRRRVYDAQLNGQNPYETPWSPRPAGVSADFDDDDDLIDVAPHSGLFIGLPWIIMLLVLAFIFVFTAFAAGGKKSGEEDKSRLGKCVLQVSTNVVIDTPCDGRNDGQVVDQVKTVVQCPSDTRAVTVSPNNVLCLAS